jgi:hypothetical protein
MKRIFIILSASTWLLACTKDKQYIQKPTCYPFLFLSDKMDGELRYIRTDTLHTQWPQTSGTLTNYLCDDDTALFHAKLDTVGCIGGGYQTFRYIKAQ